MSNGEINYTIVDLRMDYKKETGNPNGPNSNYRHSEEYVGWLESLAIKSRNEERQIERINGEIADAMLQEECNHDCGCGEACHC